MEKTISVYKNCKAKLEIDEGITRIGNGIFHGLKITTVAFPSTLTSIGQFTFYCCFDLTGVITIPQAVTSIAGNPFLSTNIMKSVVENGIT